jgi:predicted permease
MPEGFYFPIHEFLWLPLRANPNDYAVGGGPELMVFGRLAEGVSVADASTELELVGARLRAEWPETHEAFRPEVLSFARMVTGDLAEGGPRSLEVVLLQLMSFGLLAIACGNVGTLILARTAMRLNEISVRTALGASRARLLSQLFAESIVLTFGATAVGLLLAQTVVNVVIVNLGTDGLPYWFNFDLTPRIILIAFAVGAACAVIAGVLPAIKATGPRIQQNLQAHTRGATVRFGPLTTTLVVVEVALSMGFLCLCAAGFLSIGTEGSGRGDVDLSSYLIAQVRTPRQEPAEGTEETYESEFRRRTAASHEALRDRLEDEPEVLRVAMGANVPGIDHSARTIVLEGAGTWPGGWINAGRVHIDYFRDMEIRVLQGRSFDAADVEGEPDAHRPSVVVNEAFVDEVLGGGYAVGQRIRYTTTGGSEPGPWFEIVGVVETFRSNFEGFERTRAMYHPLGSADLQPMRFVVEVVGDATRFAPRLRAIAAEVDPDAIVQNAGSAAEFVARQQLEARAGMLALFALAGVGMLLAVTGLYALMSFTVSQRTREIGIRTALGAAASDIVITVARRALLQLTTGVALGGTLGWAFTQGTLDVPNMPLLVSGVATIVMVFAALACLSPTLRGLRIQPTEALREA